MRGRWLGGVVGAAFCVVAGSVACGPRASRGGFGSGATEAAVLPLDVFPASPIMTQKYGIVEWRYFIGRSQRVVTGYRADGSAARGVQLAWFPKTAQSDAHTRLLMLDGSGAAVRRSSTGAVTGTITTLQAEVVVYATYDIFRKANAEGGTTQGASFVPGENAGGDVQRLYVRRELPGPGQSAHRLGVMLDGQNGQSCGSQLSSAWTNGLSCAEGVVGTVPTVVWGLFENLPGEVQGDFSGLDKKLTDSLDTPCSGFFNNYANSLSACAPPGCTIVPGASPTGGSMLCSDSGSGENDAGGGGDEASAGDDASGGGDDGGGGGDDGGGAGDDGGGDIADQGDDGGGTGDDQGDDGGDVADQGDDGGASNSDDPPTDQEIQTADNDGTCTSCEGGATDLDVNPDNGDVSASSGDPGSAGSGQNSTTSDTSDDPGGGAAAGDNGGSTGESSSGGGASSGDDGSQDQQPAQDQQPSQDQGTQDQASQDQGTQDQGTQDSSQDQSQDAIRPHHHHHRKSGWARLYQRIVSWLN